MRSQNPYIFWVIRCIHSQTKDFFDRYLVLDKSSLSKDDYEKILMLEQSSPKSKEILRYRKYFKETTLDTFPTAASSLDYDYISGFSIEDYFEDENGNIYDEMQMMALLTGQKNPIILGNLKCILQLEPSPLKKKEEFNQNDSDTLAHFIQVYSQIARSQWRREECKLISKGGKLEAFTPAFESLVYVAIYFRQLYSASDGLFESAYKTYIRHVEDRRKIGWLTCEYDGFQSQLKSPPIGCNISISYSSKDIIEAFLYGALVFHSNTYKDFKDDRLLENRQKLKDLIEILERERFAFELNVALKLLFNYVIRAACLIKKDYGYWLSKENVPKPDIFWHEKLLHSR